MRGASHQKPLFAQSHVRLAPCVYDHAVVHTVLLVSCCATMRSHAKCYYLAWYHAYLLLFKHDVGLFCYVIYRVARARYARVRARIQRVCMCEGRPGVRVCWGVGPAKVLYSLGVLIIHGAGLPRRWYIWENVLLGRSFLEL